VVGPYDSRPTGVGGGPNHVSGDRLDNGAGGGGGYGGYGGLQWNGLARDNKSKLQTTTLMIPNKRSQAQPISPHAQLQTAATWRI